MKVTDAHTSSRGVAAATRAREAEYAACWDAGRWRGCVLRTEHGERYTVIYQGRRGGGAGPDFRDAVLARSDGQRIHGDVELHLRASDWRAHGHDGDQRYAGVVLHVVFTPLPALASAATPLPLGGSAPIVVLGRDPPAEPAPSSAGPWPCAQLAERLGSERLRALLLAAGRDRFAQREARFMRDIALADAQSQELVGQRWTPRDRTLFIAVAEALGYGRDRDGLRSAGEALAAGHAPEVARAFETLDGIGRSRMRGLVELYNRWLQDGPWLHLSERILGGSPRAAGRALVVELCAGAGHISPGRARIVAANVVLPFASAVASLDDAASLGVRARVVYDALSGLPSNAITRVMARQLRLARLPVGAAAQQGLHHIWVEWCREKRCDTCPCAGTDVTPAVPPAPQTADKPATLSEDAGTA